MNFCVVIPVFNHGDTLAEIVDRLSASQLPVIVVDDGSDSRTKALIADAVSRFGAQLITLPTNGGKGAAVEAGLKAAWKQGRTHAVQVDADGQHDLDDLNKFLDAARAHPQALISGAPLFDASVPKSRLYGRLITHFWVCVETLSTEISDAMCGFRVYPLKSTIELIENRALGRRMDFDIEILVRLHWRGVPFISIPTQVTYPEQGVSHFRLWRDNWVITRMHTRLFFGMLWRLPILVMRKFGVGRSHWSTLAERGGSLGLRILFGAYNMFGRGVFTVLLYPVIGYFYVTSPQARRASREYLDRVERALELAGNQSGKRLSSFKHFLSFGDSILDKTAMWAGRTDMGDVRYVGPSAYDDVVALGQGGIFIGSHLGNLEALRAFGGSVQGFKVNALVFTRHSPKFMKFLEQACPAAVENLIQVDTLGPDSVVRLQEKIAAGEWIAMVADRTSTSNEARAVFSQFLGDPAAFPEGPFILAALLRCPVYLLFCLKVDGRYEAWVEPFADPLELPRKTREDKLRSAVARFAQRLEQQCLTAPYQWFNFFDFWQKPQARNGE